MFSIVVLGGLAALASLWAGGSQWGDRPRVPATPEFVLLWAIGMVCAVGAAWQAKFHRLAALTMLAVAGLVTCLTFVWFSAPDLALTQLAVEAVTTVLFLLGLRWLPKRIEQDDPLTRGRARWRRSRDLVLATLTGAGLAALSYAMLTRPAPQSISPFFLSRRFAGGRRHQRRQRDAGRLSQLRHARRDHCARHRCADRVRAAAPLQAAARKHRPAAPAARAAARSGDRPRRPAHRPRRRARLHDGAGGAGAAAAADRMGGGAVPVPAWAQRAGRRLRGRAGRRHRLHRAIHGGRHAMGRGTHGPGPAALGRASDC